MYKETPEAFIRRILDDLPELEERLKAAICFSKGRSFNLKRAGTILVEMVKNKQSALSLTFQSSDRAINPDNSREQKSAKSRHWHRINEAKKNGKSKK